MGCGGVVERGGAWAAHYGVTDSDHLAIVVDRRRLPLELPEEVTLGTILGPGRADDGAQVAEYLGEENQNTFTRWEVVPACWPRRPN
jgi:hypothetical protein